MLLAKLPKDATPSLKSFRHVPTTYKGAWRLAGADTTDYREWDCGTLLMEGLHCGRQLVQLFVLDIRHRQRVIFSANSNYTALWHMLCGKGGWILEGLGESHLSAGECTLRYMPAQPDHFAVFEPGIHAFMCVSLLPLHLDAHCPSLPQLFYFEQCVQQGEKRALQQPVLPASPDIRTAFETLLSSGQPQQIPDKSMAAAVVYKKLVWQQMQRESIGDKHIQQALRVKIYLDTCNTLLLPVGGVYRHLEVGEYEGDHAFKYLTGQTTFGYQKEQKLLMAREALLYGGKQVKQLEDIIGLQANAIRKAFKTRFGMTIKEFLQSREKW